MFRSANVRGRDPEDREVKSGDRSGKREKMLDKTIADSFPASDPPSSLPDPNEDSFQRKIQRKTEKEKTKQLKAMAVALVAIARSGGLNAIIQPRRWIMAFECPLEIRLTHFSLLCSFHCWSGGVWKSEMRIRRREHDQA